MSMQLGIGLSTQRDPVLAAKEAVIQARIKLHDSKISLAIVFSSIDIASPILLKVIGSYLAGAQVLGCSGLGFISERGIFKHGLIILLLSFGEGLYFNTAQVKDIRMKSPLTAGEELGEKLLSKFKNIRRDISVVFSDGLIQSSPDLITGLQKNLGRSFPVVGALASDNLTFKKSYYYFIEEALDVAACGVILGSKLTYGLGTKHGWFPLGKPRWVTKSSGNIVNEIEHEPAVKVYEDYLAKNTAELKKELKRISILYPIGIYLPGEQEFLLRNISSIEPDGSIIFQGDVPENSEIRLMIGTKETCLDAAAQAVEEVKKGLSGRPIKFALVFDSVSRYILLGRHASKELEVLRDGLGRDTPIVGLYTYGEQAPLRAVSYLGRTYFHNQTITVLGIGA